MLELFQSSEAQPKDLKRIIFYLSKANISQQKSMPFQNGIYFLFDTIFSSNLAQRIQ